MRNAVVTATIVLMNMASTSVCAEGRALLGGGEASRGAFYTYAGTVLPLPGSNKGWVQRYWLDYFGYRYDGPPGEVDARAWGGEALAGYRWSSGSSWGAAFAGLRYTDTHLSPDDPGSNVRGSRLGIKLQLEGEMPVAPAWRAGAIGSFAFAQSGYWARLRVQRELPNGWLLGPEVVIAGNPDYYSRSYGLALSGLRWVGGHAAFKAGYRDESSGHSAYVGVELFREF